MSPIYLRSQAQRFISGLFGGGEFKARSSERDALTDRARVASILLAIGEALSAAERERAGLKKRLEDVVARASMSIGYGVDEYIDRESHRTKSLNFFDSEINRAESRLKQLESQVSHLQFLQAAVHARFPEQIGSNR